MSQNDNTTPRTIRVPDKLWREFKNACDTNFTNRTAKLNQFMQHYVHKTEMEQGHISDEAKQELEEIIQDALSRKSITLLQKIMENFLDKGVSSDDMYKAMDTGNISDMLD